MLHLSFSIYFFFSYLIFAQAETNLPNKVNPIRKFNNIPRALLLASTAAAITLAHINPVVAALPETNIQS